MDANGGGDGPSWNRELCCPWSILTTTQIKLRYPKRDLSQIDSFFIGARPRAGFSEASAFSGSERTGAVSPDFTTAGSR
jgi:hypothetical protein